MGRANLVGEITLKSLSVLGMRITPQKFYIDLIQLMSFCKI